MAALTAPRNTPQAISSDRKPPVAAATRIFAGAMVQVNAAGFAVAAAAVAANITIGIAQETIDNLLGAAGERSVKARKGRYILNNSTGADLIARTEIGKPVYVVDDNTVAKTNGGGARPVAGTCFDIDALGVIVDF